MLTRGIDMQLQRRYLKLGDEVIHTKYPQWGRGVVVEEKNSRMSGGTCLVRVVFKDGVERSFLNDLDNYSCCYYAGIRISCDVAL